MGIRKGLLSLCAAVALASPLTVVQPTPAEARWVRICVQWTYSVKLVFEGGTFRYKWTRRCLIFKRVFIPDLQLQRLRNVPIPPPPPELRRPPSLGGR